MYIDPNKDQFVKESTLFYICIPINWSLHYRDPFNRICALYILDPELKIDTCIPIDLVGEDSYKPVISYKATVLNKRLFDQFYVSDTSDIETIQWLQNPNFNLNLKPLSSYNSLLTKFRKYVDTNRYIPSVKHLEYCRHIVSQLDFSEINPPGLDFYNEVVYPGITSLERYPLTTTDEREHRLFYKIHTSTGRPSNTFNNVNYAALKKGGDLKKSIVPKHDRLVEFDFDAYHVRLLANIIGYNFPNDNIHNYFGKQYFNTETLTDSQYVESKQKTFHNLYGHGENEINFFKQVDDFRDRMYTSDNVQVPFSKRVVSKHDIENVSRSKLLNYLLQAIETEYSMIIINELSTQLETHASNLILYTYDSFLIDYNQKDGPQVLQGIIDTLRKNNMKIRIKQGVNYDELDEVFL